MANAGDDLTTEQHSELYTLLTASQDDAALRSWIRGNLPELIDGLPGKGASVAELADYVTVSGQHRGLVTPGLLRSFVKKFPKLRAQTLATARRLLPEDTALHAELAASEDGPVGRRWFTWVLVFVALVAGVAVWLGVRPLLPDGSDRSARILLVASGGDEATAGVFTALCGALNADFAQQVMCERVRWPYRRSSLQAEAAAREVHLLLIVAAEDAGQVGLEIVPLSVAAEIPMMADLPPLKIPVGSTEDVRSAASIVTAVDAALMGRAADPFGPTLRGPWGVMVSWLRQRSAQPPTASELQTLRESLGESDKEYREIVDYLLAATECTPEALARFGALHGSSHRAVALAARAGTANCLADRQPQAAVAALSEFLAEQPDACEVGAILEVAVALVHGPMAACWGSADERATVARLESLIATAPAACPLPSLRADAYEELARGYHRALAARGEVGAAPCGARDEEPRGLWQQVAVNYRLAHETDPTRLRVLFDWAESAAHVEPGGDPTANSRVLGLLSGDVEAREGAEVVFSAACLQWKIVRDRESEALMHTLGSRYPGLQPSPGVGSTLNGQCPP